MLKEESTCSNKLTGWHKEHALSGCTERCNKKGSTVAVYRAEKKTCRCCSEPPKLHKNRGSIVYKFGQGNISLIAISITNCTNEK